MSKNTRPKSRSKSKSNDHTVKSQKNDEKSKMEISLKELKEKKSKTASNNIEIKKFQNDNEIIDKKELQRLMKNTKKKMEQSRITAVGHNVHSSNSIDKLRQPSSSNSKILQLKPMDTMKQFPKKSVISYARTNSTEKLQKRDPKYASEVKNDKIRKLRNDKSFSNHIIEKSIDKMGQLSPAAKSSKLNYQNLKAITRLSLAEHISSMPSSAVDECNYEDDFDNYSDDFEEDTESEADNDIDDNSSRINTVGKNEKDKQDSKASDKADISSVDIACIESSSYRDSLLLHRLMNRRPSDDTNDQSLQEHFISHSKLAHRKIDFTNATTINWEKMLEVEQRYKILKNLIGMEIMQFDLLDHHQIHACHFYVQMFDNINYAQVQTQTGEDQLDCYVQTDEIDKETIWTQIPYSDEQGCYGLVSNSNWTSYQKKFNIDDDDADDDIERYKFCHFKMEKLCKFVAIAGQVIMDIMEPSSSLSSKNTTKLSFEYHTSLKISTGYNKFSLGNFVNSAKVTGILHQENQLFVAYYVEEASNDDIINRSIIVEFDICTPNAIKKILFCDNKIRCLCTSSDGTSALFVGLNDGSCMGYDLKESNSLFTTKLRWYENCEMYPLRTAAYDTSFYAITKKTFEEDIQFAIVAISNIQSHLDSPETYQIISVNEVGIVIIWTVINEEISTRITDYDLGLRPGAQLKMTQTSIIRPCGVLFSNSNLSRKAMVNCMTMVPINPAQFLLGTNRGIIINFISSKAIKLIGPRMFRNDFDMATEVICISFSLQSNFFLAGFSSGHISLHDITTVQPILTLEPPEKTQSLLRGIFFSPNNPTLFYTIHSNGLLLVWDVAKSKKLQLKDNLNIQDGLEVTAVESWQYFITSGNSTINLLATGFSNGEVQLHAIS